MFDDQLYLAGKEHVLHITLTEWVHIQHLLCHIGNQTYNPMDDGRDDEQTYDQNRKTMARAAVPSGASLLAR
jgi:hypothetical protein